MKLKDLYSDEKHKYFNLVLYLSKNNNFSSNDKIVVSTERKFYKNKESVVGYKFYKPISKILNEKI
jgi:hypothetical protein